MSTKMHRGEARAPLASSGWLVAAICIMLGFIAHRGISARGPGNAQYRPVASAPRGAVLTSDAVVRNPGALCTGNRAMSRDDGVVRLRRTRTKRSLHGDCQNDCGLAGNAYIPLSQWAVTVRLGDVVPPAIFLSAETTRGPPSVPYQCASVFSSGFPLPDPSSARHAACPTRTSSLTRSVSASFVAADFFYKHT